MDQDLSLPWLLVASPQLLDPHFKKSVVVIVEHTSEGSMGFILNRPVQTPLAELVNVPDVTIPEAVPAWFGGPVEKGTGIILQDRTNLAARGAGQAVGLALSSAESALVDLVDNARQRLDQLAARAAVDVEATLYPYRFVVGYAGWGAGQLDQELREGAWIQTRATWQLLFNTSWKTLWDEALGTAGANPRTLVTAMQTYLN